MEEIEEIKEEIKEEKIDLPAFFNACYQANFSLLNEQLTNNPELINKLDENHNNALHYIVLGKPSAQQLIILGYLIAKGVDINQTDTSGNNVLHYACMVEEPNPDIIAFILKQFPAKVFEKNTTRNMNPFLLAAYYNKEISTKTLLDGMEPKQMKDMVSDRATSNRSVLHLLSEAKINEKAAINIFCQLKEILNREDLELLFHGGEFKCYSIDASAFAMYGTFYSLCTDFEAYFHPLNQRTPRAALVENFFPYKGQNNVTQCLAAWANEQYQFDPYKQNTSLLLATDLLSEVNDLNGAELVDLKKKYFTLDEEALSLADIVREIEKNTGVKDRSIQFAAVGISENGGCYVTWNQYSPCVIRLGDVLQGAEHFKKVKALKERLQDGQKGLKLAHTTSNIHAETMISAIAVEFEINTILTVSASGERKQNCLFCANYLNNNGHSAFVKPHVSKLNNYDLPTNQQVKDAVVFLKELNSNSELDVESKAEYKGPCGFVYDSKPSILFRQDFSSYHIQTVDLNAEKTVQEQAACKFMIEHYPHHHETKMGTSFYSMAKRLSMPNSLNVCRYSSGLEKIKTFSNLELTLCNDGRLKRSQAQDGRVSPIDPGSPRSLRLSEKVNVWLDGKGAHNPSVLFGQSHIICKREKAKDNFLDDLDIDTLVKSLPGIDLHKK